MSHSVTASDAHQALLKLGGAPLEEFLVELEQALQSSLSECDGPAAVHASATLSAGGKRLRPLLVYIAAMGGEPAGKGLFNAAVAVELIHAATLVHDDVLDGAPLRRGKPTVFAQAGRDAATQTGDLLFARAFAMLTENGSVQQARALSAATSALAQGELLQREDAWQVDISEERYLQRCRLKTASLFRAACELGALQVDGPVSALGAFGERIGLAFQLFDDVLDVVGDPTQMGKRRGGDLLDGTVTLPLILARKNGTSLALLDLDEGFAESEIDDMCARIIATGATDRVRERALKLVSEAKTALSGDLPRLQYQALEMVADGVIERYA